MLSKFGLVTKGSSVCGAYGDWIHELGLSAGRILDALDRLKLTEDTLVIFTSDNGGVLINFGVKLQEHCAKTGVACELVYPGAPGVKHPTPTACMIAKLKEPKP